jgi:hypothetical protein
VTLLRYRENPDSSVCVVGVLHLRRAQTRTIARIWGIPIAHIVHSVCTSICTPLMLCILETNDNGRLGIGVCVGETISEKLLVFLF